MSLFPPVLDHVVIDVRDRMDEAARIFEALGFTLTPRGYHTLGSMNHLMMFGTDYLELLGFGTGGAARPELAPFPVGLNGLVFKTADADAVHAHAAGAGLPILPVQSFSRPVDLGGDKHDARFRTTRLDPGKDRDGAGLFLRAPDPGAGLAAGMAEARERRASDRPRRRRDRRAAPDGLAVRRAVRARQRRRSGWKMRDRRRQCSRRAGPPGRHRRRIRRRRRRPGRPSRIYRGGRAESGLSGADRRAAARDCGVRDEKDRVVVPARAAFNATLVFTE